MRYIMHTKHSLL